MSLFRRRLILLFRDKPVEIYKSIDNTITTNEYGTRTKVQPTYQKTIMTTIQPYSRDKLIKNYGFDILVTKVIYCDVDPLIDELVYLKYKNEWYSIKKLIEWDNHLEVFCDKCQSPLE